MCAYVPDSSLKWRCHGNPSLVNAQGPCTCMAWHNPAYLVCLC
jgi:hypothetical protein